VAVPLQIPVSTAAARKAIYGVGSIVVLVTMLLLLAPFQLFQPVGFGLDPSYAIGIHLAVQNHLRFGRDFVFNFGPLGFLVTRLPFAVDKVAYLVWDAYLMANVAFILWYLSKALKTPQMLALAFLAVLTLSSTPVIAYAVENLLLLIFLFMVFHYLKHDQVVPLILASLASGLAFYIRPGIGLAMLGMMGASLAYAWVYPRRHGRKFLAGYGAIFFLGVVASSFVLNTDLAGYVLGTLHLNTAFNDAMSLSLGSDPDAGPQYLYGALTIILLFGLGFLVDLRWLRSRTDALVQYLFAGAFILLLFKHGFVRADVFHLITFFTAVPAAVGLVVVFAPPEHNRALSRAFVAALVLSFPVASTLYSLDTIQAKFTGLGAYLARAVETTPDALDGPVPAGHRLPDRILKTIGDGSVDVMPWEISYVLTNRLHYDPRPVIQSYTAYDEYLDTLNYEKYTSDTAPEFVLYSVGDIDNRHPFFTESKTKLALLTRYRVVDRFADFLLFRRTDEPVPVSEEVLSTGQARLGETIDLDAAEGLLYMAVDTHYDILGSAARLVYQPPSLNVTVQFEDGTEKQYRAIKTILSGGCWSTRSSTRSIRRSCILSILAEPAGPSGASSSRRRTAGGFNRSSPMSWSG